MNMRSDRNQLLSKVSHFSINLVSINATTYSVQVMDCRNDEVIITLPLDPMDNTLAATICKESVAKFGEDATSVLNELSIVLRENIGTKEILLIPQDSGLPEFTRAEDHNFKRLRHASRAELLKSINEILSAHTQLTLMLDNEYQVKAGNQVNPQLALNLLNGHANFTEGKMAEYKEEERNGMHARLNNGNAESSVVTMCDNQNNLCGLIRSLGMGNGFAYLSDETIRQDILPLAAFKGKDEVEQSSNRSIFLLAYFANAFLNTSGHDHFVIIAANDRVSIYDAIGFKMPPIENNEYVLSINFNKPQALLNSIKDKLVKQDSGLIAVNLFSPETNISAKQSSAPRFDQ
jgi:hypothetical protein